MAEEVKSQSQPIVLGTASASTEDAAIRDEKEARRRGLELIYGEIEPLQCLHNMALYYQCILGSIKHLVGVKESEDPTAKLWRMSFEQVRDLRRYINSDLEHFGLEFYLQRVEWALGCDKYLCR
jgi:hypothetical protein